MTMTTDITDLAQSLKAAAEKASGGDWVKESGDGWDATCSNDDQANSGFIIAHFVGPDSEANREFVQLANPANVLALVEALEKAQQRIAVLEEAEQKLCAANVTLDARAELAERRLAEMDSRTVTVKLPVSLDFDCEMENGDYDIDEEPYLRGKVDGFNYALTKVRRLNGTAGIKWEAE